ncbi:MAG: hypothetical protein ACRDQ4_24685 [Pseudonocardiaceae bacterium]
MSEQLQLEVDAPTRAWLRRCATRTGGTVSAAAAAQLRDLALRDAVVSLSTSPTSTAGYAEASLEETERALAEAS